MWEPPEYPGPCFDLHFDRFDGFILEAEKPFENVCATGASPAFPVVLRSLPFVRRSLTFISFFASYFAVAFCLSLYYFSPFAFHTICAFLFFAFFPICPCLAPVSFFLLWLLQPDRCVASTQLQLGKREISDNDVPAPLQKPGPCKSMKGTLCLSVVRVASSPLPQTTLDSVQCTNNVAHPKPSSSCKTQVSEQTFAQDAKASTCGFCLPSSSFR